jgi:hypothetical protein
MKYDIDTPININSFLTKTIRCGGLLSNLTNKEIP